MINRKLTIKQQRFADEYIRTSKIAQSAINAGYSEKSAGVIGNENLLKPNVKAYIDERLELLKKESIAEQDEILQYLSAVMRGEVNDEQLLVTSDGFSSGIERHESRAEIMARTKAAELLGKRYIMWTDRQQTEHTGSVEFVDDIDEE